MADRLGPVAWGGIGGSGKHAADMLPDLAGNPEAVRGIVEILKRPEIEQVISRGGERAWGGIGGSGKHALDLEPEVLKKG